MPKSFYIIDGHAQIYRAYFAPFRDLNSPSGEPTRATFVFSQMLLNLVENRKPDYLAMVIDDASETALFRKEIWPEYKANRKARPDDFNPQEERILQIVRDAGVPNWDAKSSHGIPPVGCQPRTTAKGAPPSVTVSAASPASTAAPSPPKSSPGRAKAPSEALAPK